MGFKRGLYTPVASLGWTGEAPAPTRTVADRQQARTDLQNLYLLVGKLFVVFVITGQLE